MRYEEEIERAAEEFREKPIEAIPFSLYRLFDETGDRLRYEDAYFSRRRRLVALGLEAYRCRSARDIAALEDAIWAICDEFTWSLPAHLGGRSLEGEALDEHGICLDLFACETAFALSEIRDLFLEDLAPIVSSRARMEVLRRVLRPFLARVEPWNWELMRNNWCAVCGGSIGAAALYLLSGEELDATLRRVYPSLERFLESFSEDGACLEGLGYWTYGVGFFVSFAELLFRRSDGRIDLMSTDKFRRVAAFQSAAYLNETLSVSFADGAQEERYRPGLSAYLARRFPEARLPAEALAARLSDDHCGRWCLSFRDLLWAKIGAQAEASAIAPQKAEPRWFPDAQWLICPAQDAQSIAFAAKGGDNDEPHNHNDIGSFILACGSEQLIADLGAGEYVKNYFNKLRYTIFCNSSLGHGVPIVDGQGQLAGADRMARGVEFAREGESVILQMDMTSAYENPNLRKLTRRFQFSVGGELLLTDTFEFERTGSTVTERFLTRAEVSSVDGMNALILGKNSQLLIVTDAPFPIVRQHSHKDHSGNEIMIRSLNYNFGVESLAGEMLKSVLKFRFLPIVRIV